MVETRQVVAIIPARGGSKSIPRKNLKYLGRYPLIAYSIAAGLQARTVDRVIVSTDDEEIAAVARRWGAEVPFLRPAELAADDTTDLPVFKHALGWLYDESGVLPDVVVQLRPTSPIRPPDCVDRAVETLVADPAAESVRGVVPSGQNPYKMWSIDRDGRLSSLLTSEFPEPYNMPRQALPQTYWQTGHIDVMRSATIMEDGSMTGRVIRPLVIDPRYTVDLDTPLDWEWASWHLEHIDLPVVLPSSPPETGSPEVAKQLLSEVRLLVLDFDGVLTDNRVWVSEDGREMVACDRSDGLGLEQLRRLGVDCVVLSTETNPVVSARCRKLGLRCSQGLRDKAEALRALVDEAGLSPLEVAYVGNDVNDLPAMRLVAGRVAVADAQPAVLAEANLVLSTKGGHGAVRELCDIIVDVQRRVGHA